MGMQDVNGLNWMSDLRLVLVTPFPIQLHSVLQIISLQEECKAHVEARRHESGRLEKYKRFLEEDAAEQEARVSPWD